MNAIIKQGGHQYNIAEGDVIRVDLFLEKHSNHQFRSIIDHLFHSR